jgi:uncharacterized protein YaaW (UPF0174 family)
MIVIIVNIAITQNTKEGMTLGSREITVLALWMYYGPISAILLFITVCPPILLD